jgi:hypothetical protein
MTRRGSLGVWLLAALAALAVPAEAQRPFATLDPFYQEESARRVFYDGFAAQAEVSYQGARPISAPGDAPFDFSVRFDYALVQQVDLAVVFDLGGRGGDSLVIAPVRLSWVVAKPYWRHEHTDYAVRLAIDPATEGGFGFRQTDVAFLSSTDHSPVHSTDFAIGLRRARVGFEQFVFDTAGPLDAGPQESSLGIGISRSRAVGTEFHAMWGHRFWLHPGGSHVFVTVMGQFMDYDLITIGPPQEEAAARTAPTGPSQNQYRGSVGWLRTGVEYTRPSFVVSPYASLPLFRWVEIGRESRAWGPRPDHVSVGLRLTVR